MCGRMRTHIQLTCSNPLQSRLDHFLPPVKSHIHVPKLLGAGMQPARLASEPTLEASKFDVVAAPYWFNIQSWHSQQKTPQTQSNAYNCIGTIASRCFLNIGWSIWRKTRWSLVGPCYILPLPFFSESEAQHSQPTYFWHRFQTQPKNGHVYKPCRGTGSVARTASAPAAPAERATVGEARGSHCAAPPAELLRNHRANLPRDRCWRNLGGRDPWWAFLGWTWTVGKIWQLVCFVWDVNIDWGVDDAEQIRKWWAMAMAGLKHPHVSNTPSITENASTR